VRKRRESRCRTPAEYGSLRRPLRVGWITVAAVAHLCGNGVTVEK
jgi:hypothetical protein